MQHALELAATRLDRDRLQYIAIARTSRATATRDLQDLVAKGALVRTGERKHTRYTLNLTTERATPPGLVAERRASRQ